MLPTRVNAAVNIKLFKHQYFQVPCPANFQDFLVTTDDDQQSPDRDIRKLSPSDSSGADSDEAGCTCDGSADSQHARHCQLHRGGHKQRNAFGSLGRTMSKRIKSLGTLKKMGRPGSFRRKAATDDRRAGQVRRKTLDGLASEKASYQDFILAANIHTEKRMEYQASCTVTSC